MLFSEFLDGLMEAGAFLHFGIIVLAPDVPGKDGGEGGIGDGFTGCGFFAVVYPTDESAHIDGVRAANLFHEERGIFIGEDVLGLGFRVILRGFDLVVVGEFCRGEGGMIDYGLEAFARIVLEVLVGFWGVGEVILHPADGPQDFAEYFIASDLVFEKGGEDVGGYICRGCGRGRRLGDDKGCFTCFLMNPTFEFLDLDAIEV